MAYRIEIGLKRGVHDARGSRIAVSVARSWQIPVLSVKTRNIYKIDAKLNSRESTQVRRAFTDPVIEKSAIGRLKPPQFDWLVEVGFQPGVTDNVGRTARVALEDILRRALDTEENVFTAIP